MARERTFLFALNGGLVSPLALARTDLQRMRLTAQVFENCVPRVIGALQFRAGTRYLSSTKSDAAARQIPFVFSVTDTASIELTENVMRFIVGGDAISRVAVSTTITNGDFSSGTGWTLTTTGSATCNINSSWPGGLYMECGPRGSQASCERSFSVSGGDQSKEHAVRIVVLHGTIKFRLGSTSGGQEIIPETELTRGTYSLAFTPGVATVYLKFATDQPTWNVVDSVTIESSGTVELTTEWGASDLFSIRYEQSGDVIFVADGAHSPMRIERRGSSRSWALTKYQFRNGPWRGKTANITLSASNRVGIGNLTASAPFFKPEHIGALFELTHTQTTTDVQLAGTDQYTDPVRVSGVDQGATRSIFFATSGTWVGKISEQISYDDGETWQNYGDFTVNSSATRKYGADNVTVLARLGFQAGDYTSGVATAGMSSTGGGGTGIVRITNYLSSTLVNYEVVERLHYTGATENWREGKFSGANEWPTSVALFEGRLWWGSRDQLSGSYVDDFTNYDVDEEGDAAPIIRSIATGPVNEVQWLLGLARLIIGTSGAESVARSSSFDEPMSPTNFSIKDASTYGSADIQAVKIDREGYFVHRSKKRAYVLSYSVEANDYVSQEISRYNPTVLEAGVKMTAVQRNPDTRIWNVMDDGTVACLTYEKTEDVVAWHLFTTDGTIEDVIVLPNTESDDVYFIVNRTINGVTKRYRERLSYDTEAMGGTNNYISDCFKETDVVATATITGLSHLEGKSVVVWAAGAPVLDANNDPATFTVASGQITLPSSVTGHVIVGLPYEGRWKSTKLAYAAQTGTAMSQRKTITSVAPILYASHNKAALFGTSFDGNMDPINQVFEMEDLGAAMLDSDRDYDYDAFAVEGEWSPDARICMKFRSPLPCTVLGVGLGIEAHEDA